VPPPATHLRRSLGAAAFVPVRLLVCCSAALALHAQESQPQPELQAQDRAPAAGNLLAVRGRCVDPATGEGLARCTVKLTGHMATGYPIAWGIPEFVDPPEAVTGEDGKFEFRIAPPLGWDSGAGHSPRFHLGIEHAARASWFGHCAFQVLGERSSVDCGDVPMTKGSRPPLRIVDTEGKPAAGIVVEAKQKLPEEVILKGVRKSEDGHLKIWEERWHRVRSDLAGMVPWPDPLLPGHWSLQLEGRERLSGPEVLEVPADGSAPRRVEIVVAAAPKRAEITGRIVASDGRPASGGVIEVLAGQRGQELCSVRVAEDGTFRIARPTKDMPSDEVYLRLQRNNRYDDYTELGPARFGGEPLVFETRPRRPLVVSVQDAQGHAVRGASIHAHPLDEGVGLDPVRFSGELRDGSVELTLCAGRWEILAVPADPKLAPSEWVSVSEEALAKPLRIVVPSRVLGTVRVCDGSGQGVAGAKVRVFDGVRRLPGPIVTTPGAVLCARGQVARDAVIAEGVTAADGQVTLPGTLERGQLTIEVRGRAIRDASFVVDAWGTKVFVASVERQ
jgi:hypothetical protein